MMVGFAIIEHVVGAEVEPNKRGRGSAATVKRLLRTIGLSDLRATWWWDVRNDLSHSYVPTESLAIDTFDVMELTYIVEHVALDDRCRTPAKLVHVWEGRVPPSAWTPYSPGVDGPT
jgi:hypothetical protein